MNSIRRYWTVQTTWNPGSLIASGPSADARSDSAYFVGSTLVDYDYDYVCPLDCCHARHDDDSHRGRAYATAAFRPSYRRRWYLAVSYASPFAGDCRTTRAPPPSLVAANRPATRSPAPTASAVCGNVARAHPSPTPRCSFAFCVCDPAPLFCRCWSASRWSSQPLPATSVAAASICTYSWNLVVEPRSGISLSVRIHFRTGYLKLNRHRPVWSPIWFAAAWIAWRTLLDRRTLGCPLHRRSRPDRFVSGEDASGAEAIRRAMHGVMGRHSGGVDAPCDGAYRSLPDGIELMVSHRFEHSAMHGPVHASHAVRPFLVALDFVGLNATFPVSHRPDDGGRDVIANSMDLIRWSDVRIRFFGTIKKTEKQKRNISIR